RSLEGLQQSAERGASLVKQLLMIARKTEFVLQEVYIDDIAKEVIQLLSETFPKDIVISLNFKTVPPAIVGDANQLHQVILNLCVNARDAMPKGGSLTITTSIAQGELFTSNGSHPDGKEYVLIQVSDTGTGMDDATKERIFDLFFTTKDPGKGTGLGLSLVHSIVENHGGYIDVESSLNEGTTFNIYLPIPEYNITRVDVPGPALEDVPGGNETILFIEDEMLLREYLRELLESKGYTVVTAINGEDGVAMFSHHRHEIDIVLSDFGLPKFSGDEVLKRITSLDAHAKIIFVSGYIDPDKKQELLNAGARRVIQKPYSTPLVLHTIREVIDEPGD
ncbi:MAG TPA: ATP-binding protein, partial [Bacteroidota bacterium]|nr:ATP-binding protein [Bacteroidota bacterium]